MRVLIPFGALLATWAFFHEYLPPSKRVNLVGDITGYHYPLLTFAHKSVRQGHMPQWDPSIYCGIPFAANIQVGLFYPGNWVLPLFNRGRDGLRLWTVEMNEFLHFWLAFVFAWLWLRRRAGSDLPAILGASVVSFSGYAIGQSEHYGVIQGYAWFPFALWGVEEFARGDGWRKLWKVAVASAMTFLAGYPPTWVVLAVCIVSYSLGRLGWKRIPAVAAATFAGLFLAAVQLLPTLEALPVKMPEDAFGGGLRLAMYRQFFLPNLYDQSHRSGSWMMEEQYYFVGSLALLAVGWILYKKLFAGLLPAAAMVVAALWLAQDPGGWIHSLGQRLPILMQVLEQTSFLLLFTLAAAMATAAAAADVRMREWKQSKWIGRAAMAAALLWNARQLWVWRHDGAGFGIGWWSAREVIVVSIIFFFLIRAGRSKLITAMLLFTMWTEYKVFGTNRRFSSSMAGNIDKGWAGDASRGGREMKGVAAAVYAKLLATPEYRVGLVEAMHATEARHYGLSTPQGFDPFLPLQYRQEVEQYVKFETNREFQIDWRSDAMLQAFGVGYILTAAQSTEHSAILGDSRFELMEPSQTFYHVFRYRDAKPAYRFAGGTAKKVRWLPERRSIRVFSESGGELTLLEQYFPGWVAYVDGDPVPMQRYGKAFQKIHVPAGRHMVEFKFNSPGLWRGMIISMLSIAALIAFVRYRRASFSPSAEPTPPASAS